MAKLTRARAMAETLADHIGTARENIDAIEGVVISETDTSTGEGRARRAYLQVKIDEARMALSQIAVVFKEE